MHRWMVTAVARCLSALTVLTLSALHVRGCCSSARAQALFPPPTEVSCAEAFQAATELAQAGTAVVRSSRTDVGAAERRMERSVSTKDTFQPTAMRVGTVETFRIAETALRVDTDGHLFSEFALFSPDSAPRDIAARRWDWVRHASGTQSIDVRASSAAALDHLTPDRCLKVSDGMFVVQASEAGAAGGARKEWFFILERKRSQQEDLFGFADLHTHLAAHLGLGGNASGVGPFWGRPGRALDTSSLSDDLPRCMTETHGNVEGGPPDEDFEIRVKSRKQLMAQFEPATDWYRHGPGGPPAFDNWPHADSLSHQKMHVTWLRRAFDGGLRLMVTSPQDSQIMRNFYHQASAHPAPLTPDVNADYNAALAQLSEIRCIAAANSTWMKVVATSADARETIKAGKMAIVLGVELDQLNESQLVDLVQNHQVRVVTLIHLADNAFGGAAVYRDLFNANNAFLTGRPFAVEASSNVAFRLGDFMTLTRPDAFATRLGDASACSPGYMCCALGRPAQPGCIAFARGMINKHGLSPLGVATMTRLARMGALTDLAHMSHKSVEAALSEAERNGYPVVDTHTGIRNASCDVSERGLTSRQAERLRKLQGVIGLGTAGNRSGVDLLATTHEDTRVLSATSRSTYPLSTAQTGQLRLTYAMSTIGFVATPAAVATLRIAGRPPLSVPLSVPSGSVLIGVPELRAFSDAESIELSSLAAVLTKIKVEARVLGSWKTLMHAAGAGSFGIDAHRFISSLQRGGDLDTCERDAGAIPGTPVRHVLVRINTTSATPVRGRLTFRDASSRLTNVSFSVHDFARVELPMTMRADRLTSVAFTGTGELRSVSVEAIPDPMELWVAGAASALDTAGGRGIALGTDLNSPDVELPFTAVIASDPVSLATKQGLGKQARGNGQFYNFARDGLAQVGQLPDFVMAAGAVEGGGRVASALMHSAEDFLRAWRKLEGFRGSHPGETVSARPANPTCQ